MRRLATLVVATAAAAALAVVIPAPAQAVAVPSDPIVTGLAGPLQFDVGSSGQIYVAQDFSGVLTKVRPNGSTKDLVAEPGEVAGVVSSGFDVVYTFTGGTEASPVALLKRRLANGTTQTIADLGQYEQDHNPDGFQAYGFRRLTAACIAQLPPELRPYTGIVESHPYAVANAPGGGWLVADAAGNDILKVSPSGDIEVYKVLKPQKVGITAEVAEAQGLPACTIGKIYGFEPVPTDVEVNSRGAALVSLLPGGPEDASLGARGSVIRIAGDGEFALYNGSFFGATNLALGIGGRIYVTELFANRVSVLRNGVVTKVADLVEPAGVEYADGTLYVSTNVFGNGSIVTIDVP